MHRKPTPEHDQLTVMYILSAADMVLSEDQLSRVVTDLGLMSYFDLKAALHALAMTERADATPVLGGTAYELSDSGRDLLEAVRPDLRRSVRDAVDGYMEEHRDALEAEATYAATYARVHENEYRASARILSGGTPFFEMHLLLETREEAEAFVAKWPLHASELYQKVLLDLT